jgi:hypothetical protein
VRLRRQRRDPFQELQDGLAKISGEMNATAERLLEQGDRPGAIALWRALAMDGNADGVLNMVVECSADGRYDQALGWWRGAAERGIVIPPHEPGVRLHQQGPHRHTAAEGWWKTAGEELDDALSREHLERSKAP